VDRGSKLYIYCLIDTPELDELPCKGINDSSLALISWDGIAVVSSQVDVESIKVTTETIIRHEEVVEYLMKDHTVLPMRFGTVVQGASEVTKLLVKHHESIRNNIDKIRGNVEIGVKILLKSIPVDLFQPAEDFPLDNYSPGRRYLLEKYRQFQKQKRILENEYYSVDEIYGSLKAHAIQSCAQKFVTEKMLLNSSFLVAKEKVTEFKETVEFLKKRYPSLSFLYSGPWPAYNFVSLSQGGNS
jgi:hypothetical protein